MAIVQPLDPALQRFALPPRQAALKRALDIAASAVLLVALSWLIAILILLARLDTGASGLFRQQRVGLFGLPFTHLKIRTMRPEAGQATTVTRHSDPRITRLGAILRRTRLDELPQLINVLRGDMSMVGPRPDMAEMYEGLTDNQLRVLTVRPGITGPATLAFRNEGALLDQRDDFERYNRQVIFPEKIRINLAYIDNYRIWDDIRIMFRTLFG